MSSVGGERCTSEASQDAKETCNVVIFGETGAGKSSLINLITGTQRALTSCDAMGCTAETNTYDILIQNETLKVTLFDTVGLDEGSEGTVPDKEAQQVLKKLIQSLQDNVHLLMYCVRGVRARKALYRNYNFIRSQVKERVPIVLVVTCLEDHEPEMEDWWKDNERLISDFGMTFAGHACVTTVTIDDNVAIRLEQRHNQSYLAVCQLIEQCRRKGHRRPLLDAGERQQNTIWRVPPKMATRSSIVLTGESVASNGSPTNVKEIATTYADKQRLTLQRKDTIDDFEVFNTTNRRKVIVVFGQTGAGKSSLVNLMAGKEVAHTSPDTQRCTMQWKEYSIDFDGGLYTVFDTIGLEEPQLGIKEYLESVENAYQLLRKLEEEGGIDLLLFCVCASKVTATLQSNYRLFHEFLCCKKVPIVLVITNLEREQRMENWWERNEGTLDKYQIKVAGHACITAANRLDGRHKDLYEESRVTIRNLVKNYTADGQKQAWMGGHNLFVSFMRKLKGSLIGGSHVRRKDIVPRLTKRCGISTEAAKELANMIKQDIA
ncbi:P-loop containing nucleoside triphosphate hydrolase protein [Suillus fuscotomentosus]|uniref:P-loop containing nucleoside triphosphate hydrolase protein n=1 Tax=Suillus fuscotomentosus TaxID=1912939 RepID=A0AAD4DXQ4_9AGAM|nr:P-loop containing nucleoside triphosphate hydrolase protein [Suillus fuscotomentosus]KAG1896046.1 P-loop containing nucleoside triphosphate hydrolase protein [Suillus fuscotomentosus]